MKKKGKGQAGKNGGGLKEVKKTIAKQGGGKPGRKSKAPKKGEWNLVPVGEEFFTNKEFDNLVSFEELVDYDVVTKADGTKEILSGGTSNGSGEKTRSTEGIDAGKVADIVSEPSAKAANKSKKGKKRKSDNPPKDNEDLEVINTSAGKVVVENDADFQVTVDAIPINAPTNETNEKKKQRKKKANRGSKKSEVTDKVEEEAAEVESEDDENHENGADADNVEEEDFEETEWLKLGVPELVVKALKQMKFNTPTTIQSMTLPAAILGKKDIVGAAETGSGKTLAFAIPIIDGILKYRKITKQQDDDASTDDHLSALILTPTRELAVQIKNHIDGAAKFANIKTVVIVGGLASQKQERLLRGRPDIVIATPGRLWELVQEGDNYLSTLSKIKYLAIDETDRMVEKGHFQELEGILSTLNTHESSKEIRQNFVFSATLSFTHEPPKRLQKIGNKKMKMQQPKKLSAKEKLKQIIEMVGVRQNPKIVDITTSKGTCETLTERQISCTLDNKDYYLYYFLLQHPGRTIVFSNSINCVRRLTNLFFLLQCGEVLPLHSEMHQKQRLRNLEKFTSNDKGVLFATDVAARGLDIKNIEHVIHYQVPKTAESYIHRSGRTARAFKGGIAILMVEPGETTTVKNIFRSLGREEMLANFSVDGKIFREIKNTVEMAVKVEQFEHSVRKKLADHNWMEKAKKDMDLVSSSDDDDDDNPGEKKQLMQAKKKLESYKNQLSQMIVSNNKS